MSKSFHASFDDTLEAQEKLIVKVKVLREENRLIRDGEEEKELRQLVGRACLGWDGEEQLAPFNLPYGNKKISFAHLGCAIERIMDWGGGRSDDELTGLEPAVLWNVILNCLFVILPRARRVAYTKSPERVPWEPQTADRV